MSIVLKLPASEENWRARSCWGGTCAACLRNCQNFAIFGPPWGGSRALRLDMSSAAVWGRSEAFFGACRFLLRQPTYGVVPVFVVSQSPVSVFVCLFYSPTMPHTWVDRTHVKVLRGDDCLCPLALTHTGILLHSIGLPGDDMFVGRLWRERRVVGAHDSSVLGAATHFQLF